MKPGNWLKKIRIAAPAVKPTMTECDTRLTSWPRFTRPRSSWKIPASRVMLKTALMNSGDPGAKFSDRVAKITTEIAVVGPETRCHELPKRAAITGVTIAV